MEQRVYNLIKSIVNIDEMVRENFSINYILETIQAAYRRQNRECPISYNDVLSVVKMLEECETYPIIPNKDINDAKDRVGRIEKNIEDSRKSASDIANLNKGDT